MQVDSVKSGPSLISIPLPVFYVSSGCALAPKTTSVSLPEVGDYAYQNNDSCSPGMCTFMP